jgi:hypothetical protein
MDVSTAAGAARRLSVDVANLSYRVAFLEQDRAELVELAQMLQPHTWRRSMGMTDPDAEKSDTVAVVTIDAEQVGILDQILSRLNDLM